MRGCSQGLQRPPQPTGSHSLAPHPAPFLSNHLLPPPFTPPTQYIYDGSEGPFEKLPSSYRCPVCSAPKRRFKPYAGGAGRNDAKSMNARWEAMQGGRSGGGGGGKVDTGAFAAAGAAAAAALAGLWFYLNSQFQ